jgi:hypothetical protein
LFNKGSLDKFEKATLLYKIGAYRRLQSNEDSYDITPSKKIQMEHHPVKKSLEDVVVKSQVVAPTSNATTPFDAVATTAKLDAPTPVGEEVRRHSI